MTRRQIREQIFRLLFSAEFFAGEDRDEQLELNLDRFTGSVEVPDTEDAPFPKTAGAEEADYIRSKVLDICAHLEEIDERINSGVEGWKTSRMAKAELAIIRLAVYEIDYEDDMPVSVAINEAVELAKRYGSEKGPAFVNGVLAKLV